MTSARRAGAASPSGVDPGSSAERSGSAPALRPSRGAALAALLYMALAVASTWPLAVELGDGVPQGRQRAVTVPYAMTWAVWYTGDRLRRGDLAGYWDAPIFHPTPSAFAFSEPVPLLGALGAPLGALGLTPWAVVGVLLLLAYTTNGLLAWSLLGRASIHPWARLLGGAAFVLLPYTQREIGTLTLVPIAFVLATLHALLAFSDRPTPGRGALLGGAYGCAWLVCGQHALFLALALAVTAWLLPGRHAFRREAAPGWLVAALIAAALVLPVALAQRAAFVEHGFHRTAETAWSGAGSPAAFWRVPFRQLVPLPFLSTPEHLDQRALFPGTVRLSLAVFAGLWAVRRAHHRSLCRFLAALALSGVVLALVPKIAMGDVQPWAWVQATIPGMAQLRGLWRFALMLHVGVGLLAAVGLHAVYVEVRRRRPRAAGRSRAALVALGVLMTIEIWPPHRPVAAAPDLDAHAGLVAFLRHRTAPDEPVVFVPLALGHEVRDYAGEARWMLVQTRLRRPLLNGYSSFFPADYFATAEAARGYPDVASVSRFRARGVRWVVVDREWLADRALPASLGRVARVERALGLEVHDVSGGP